MYIWSYINQGTINVLYIVLRVGNLLIRFSSDSLDFCEQKNNSLVKRANRSHHSLVVSNLSEEPQERRATGAMIHSWA